MYRPEYWTYQRVVAIFLAVALLVCTVLYVISFAAAGMTSLRSDSGPSWRGRRRPGDRLAAVTHPPGGELAAAGGGNRPAVPGRASLTAIEIDAAERRAGRSSGPVGHGSVHRPRAPRSAP